ncbi:MAG: flavin reductase family protein [Clostridiales bacterium]|nr:flavin reductase family protein [Candidatus Crickella merdequi]
MKKYKKINSKPGPMLYPLPAVLVSCASGDEDNLITIGWTGIINTTPPMTYVSVRKERHSHHLIKESGEFVINLANVDMVKALDYCGVRSGRHEDKFETAGLTRVPADIVAAPMVAESPVSIECKVVEIKEYPSHDMFIAEIVACHVAEDYVADNGAYEFERMRLVSYNHGKYYELKSSELGFFGYSIMKPKTAKRRRQQQKTKKEKKYRK